MLWRIWHNLFLWRGLRRRAIRGNLKMVLARFIRRARLLKVLIPRWRVLCCRPLGTIRKFQESNNVQKRGNGDKYENWVEGWGGKRWEEQTWRGASVLVPFWWRSACSSAAMHGTFSHTSCYLGSVEQHHEVQTFSQWLCCGGNDMADNTSEEMLTFWFPQRRARPLGSTTLNTRVSRSSHRMYSWYRSSHSSW